MIQIYNDINNLKQTDKIKYTIIKINDNIITENNTDITYSLFIIGLLYFVYNNSRN